MCHFSHRLLFSITSTRFFYLREDSTKKSEEKNMSIDRPPSVFVSSTINDLAQVRKELGSFIEKDLGMVPVLSDFSSFPVDPDLDAIENCLVRVREKADIFVLVVGGRYGSVTNREYLWAKAKGIPLYVFVQKNILAAHSDWKKNRSGDFSEIVDSSKLFDLWNCFTIRPRRTGCSPLIPHRI
jgi:hypothetical protein